MENGALKAQAMCVRPYSKGVGELDKKVGSVLGLPSLRPWGYSASAPLPPPIPLALSGTSKPVPFLPVVEA